jgi:uncharacterized protein (TIGR02246 family)
MNKTATLALQVGTLAVLALGPAGGARAEDSSAAIKAADAAWSAAFASGDARAVAAIYTANGQVLAAGSEPVTGTAGITKLIQAFFDEGAAKVELTPLEIYGQGRYATEVGRYVIKDKAGKATDHGKYVELWRLEGGAWKLHRDIFNTSVAPAK